MREIVLHYAPDNASLIVRIVLEELQLKYRAELVDRSIGQQYSEGYRRLNPTGLIPVCVIDDVVVSETAAIVLTLAESAGSWCVPGADEKKRAVFLRWLFFLSNTLHADLRQLFYAEQFVGDDDALQASYRVRTRSRLTANLKILDTQYASQDTTYLLAPEPTVGDVYLAVCLRWLQLYPLIDRGWFVLAEYPSLHKMAEAMQSRSAVIRACEMEGIRGRFFTDATDAEPGVGSAL